MVDYRQADPAAPHGELRAEQERVANRILELRGKLGLLPQQAEQARSLTMMWSLLGLLLFVLTYAVWARTQGWPRPPGIPRLEEWGRHAVAFFGILFGLPLIALSTMLIRIYQNQELSSGLLNRLPIAFNLPLYSPTPFRKRFQAVVLFLFLVFPLAGQIHFFAKMCRGKVYERSGWVERTDIGTGIVNQLTSPVPLGEMFEGDNDVFRLEEGDGSITYYPFVEPWLFLALEVLVFVYFAWTIRQMTGWPNGARLNERSRKSKLGQTAATSVLLFLLLPPPASEAVGIDVSLAVFQDLLERQVFTQEQRFYLEGDPGSSCTYAYLENPRLSIQGDRVRLRAHFSGRLAAEILGSCVGPGDAFEVVISGLPYARGSEVGLEGLNIEEMDSSVPMISDLLRDALADQLPRAVRFDLDSELKRLVGGAAASSPYRLAVSDIGAGLLGLDGGNLQLDVNFRLEVDLEQ